MGEKRQLRVFLCHSSADKPLVRDLYKLLAKESWIDPWLDEVKIKPGQDWELEIENAINKTDVVIVILSQNSVSRDGFVQKEMKIVLDKSDEKPEGIIYIIPVRIEKCDVPKRLAKLHWLEMSADNADWYTRLREALVMKAELLDISVEEFEAESEQYQTEVEKLKRSLEIREIELKAVLAQAHEIINTDSLTHLSSRRKIMFDLQEEVVRVKKYNNSLSIILIELDQYNDIRESYDRFMADDLLREFADNLKELIYHPKTIGRLEGGEFLIVLPASDISDAIKLVENLFERVRTKLIDSDGKSVNITASVGVVQFLQGQEIWEQMLLRADKAIRKAKENGGNRWETL